MLNRLFGQRGYQASPGSVRQDAASGCRPTPPDPIDRHFALHLDLSKPVEHPSVTVNGAFGPNSVLVLDSRVNGNVKIAIRVAAPKPRDVVLKVGHIGRGRIGVTVTGSGIDVHIGCSVRLFCQIGVGNNAFVRIGDHTTSSGIEISSEQGSVRIGANCQTAAQTMVMGAAHHGIVDLSQGQPQIVPQSADVVVGDHVWLGYRSYIGGRARVGNGCIVAACASVVAPTPANCLIAGNPATVRRRNVGWSREATRIDARSLEYLRSVKDVSGRDGDDELDLITGDQS